MTEKPNWDFPDPFTHEIKVSKEHIDIMGHVNNVQYLHWLENIAWGHSEHLGLDWDYYEKENRAMVARRHELDYLAAGFFDDDIVVGTWITENDGRLWVTRSYQIIRKSDGATLLRGKTNWVCINIKSGKPSRMPKIYVDTYKPVGPK